MAEGDVKDEEKQKLMAEDEKPAASRKKEDKDGTRQVNLHSTLYISLRILCAVTPSTSRAIKM